MPTDEPMKLMICAELGSTGAFEMSLFHRLSDGNGTKPPRLAPWPVDICEQLEVCVEPFTWKFTPEEALLPGSGFCTITENVPALPAVPVAVSCVDETNVVASAVLLNITCAPDTKFVPVSVSEKLPRFVVAGEMPVSVGVGFQRVMAAEPDLVESAALVAVTLTVLGEGGPVGAE